MLTTNYTLMMADIDDHTFSHGDVVLMVTWKLELTSGTATRRVKIDT